MADSTLPQLIMNSIAASAQGSPDNQPLQMVGDMVSNYLRSAGLASHAMWKPVYSMKDSDDYLTIYVDLPGVPVDAVNMTFHNSRIEISGERYIPDNHPLFSNVSGNNPTSRTNQGGVPYGKFHQRINMPISVTNPESVKTKMKLGVLTITIDKSVESRGVFSVNVSN